MQRSPAFIFDDARAARVFGDWVREHFDEIKAVAETTTRSGKLVSIFQYAIGPLRNLRFNAGLGSGGGTDLFTVIAEITVHGRTGNGRAVSTMGRLQINFADFADTP